MSEIALNKEDFPEFLDPMTIKELRQGLRARLFVVPFVAVHLVVLVALIFEYLIATESVRTGTAVTSFDDFVQYGLFWTVVGLVLLVVTPLGGIASVRQELDGRNQELLLLTRLTRWKLVLGKWMVLNGIGW
ncbi:MAG: hypothetical protein AAF514_15150, partial [Verrucomicrobiota bacterium]